MTRFEPQAFTNRGDQPAQSDYALLTTRPNHSNRDYRLVIWECGVELLKWVLGWTEWSVWLQVIGCGGFQLAAPPRA